MRILVLIVYLAFSLQLSAQKANQPFSGAIEMGLGWGIPIDFNIDNNILTSKFLGYRLLEIPWQAGIHVSKALGPVSYMELGLVFHERSSSWASSYAYTQGNPPGITTHYINEHHVLALDCIDFSLKYYKFLKYGKNRELYAFGGIAPLWVLHVAYADDLNNNSVPRDCFRSWNLAVNGGLALEKGNIRWKLLFDLAVVSVVNSEYARVVPEEERAWGTKIYPFEVLLCCAYLIR
ncbi:MAG: hypothetical protein V2B15_15605 [Bacteroidota bacterium]